MKKITNRMISFAFLMCMGLFLFNLRVNAANNVTTINASGDTQGATISGTTDDDVVAVLIEVLDGTNVVTLETHAVISGAYNATLTCTLDEGKTYTAYVKNYNGAGESKTTTFSIPISVTGVTVSPTTGTLTTAGSTLQLTATVTPANATNPAVTWSSGNTSVATVDNTGKVTAVANGTATITVTTTDQNKTATATITVTISSGTGSGTGNGSGGGTGSGSGSGSSNGGNGTASSQNDSGSNEYKEVKVNVPIEYLVVKGDALGKIARKYHLTLQQLLSMNPQIKNPNLIRVGQKIVVGYTEKTVTTKVTDKSAENNAGASTNPVYYTVQRGDSLYKIARMNRLTLNKLISLNPDVMNKKYIYPGQKIRVK